MSGKRENVRVGVIGAGHMANNVHLPSMRDMDDVTVVALCDLVLERVTNTAKKFDIRSTYLSYHDMLAKENLDAILCLVDPSNHFHVVRHCLEAGLDVFMEKPPGITLFQAESMSRMAGKAGKILMVGFNRRYIPVVRKVKEEFDKLTHPTQVEGCMYKYGSGAFDRGGMPAFASDTIHAVDLVRWFAGATPVEAHTVTMSVDEPVINAWISVSKFDNGAIGVVKGNYRTGGRVHRFEIHGPGASAYINLGMGGAQCEAILLRHDGGEQYSLSAGKAGGDTGFYFSGTELAGSDEFYRFYGFYQEDRHFIDCVKSRNEPETSIQEAVKSFAYVDMILSNIH